MWKTQTRLLNKQYIPWWVYGVFSGLYSTIIKDAVLTQSHQLFMKNKSTGVKDLTN